MALTMVPLLVASRWSEGYPGYAGCPEFYLGAISPDAIHIRDKDDKSHKNEIHLNNWMSPHPNDVIDYWHDHTTPFDIGYGVHVLTDAQWVPRFRQRFPDMILPNGMLDTDIYYNDTFVTDFELYRREPSAQQMFQWLACAKAPSDHPLLTHYELDEWRKVILNTYRGTCPRHDPVCFIDVDYVLDFVQDCITLINRTYEEGLK